MRYALILAGGSGTRLWPMSRAARPKQLIPFLGGRSLLELAVDRAAGLVEPDRVLICTAEAFREPIRRLLPRLADAQILGEPEGRDTLAAVGFPAALVARRDPEAVFAVLTADHLIEPVDAFRQVIRRAFEVVEAAPATLATFGIAPTHPSTGFGYVELGDPLPGREGIHRVARFVEKPDAATAEAYVRSGRYRWNSGMFVWKAATLLDCIRRYEPEVGAGLDRIAADGGTDRGPETLRRIYPGLKKVSVDYGVMERAARDDRVKVAAVSMAVTWLDVGSWPAYAETLPHDAAGNRTSATSRLADCRGTLVVSDDPGHLVAALGVEDLIVVHTRDATLVCRRDRAQAIKDLAREVDARWA